MKKLLSFALILALMVSLIACGDSGEQQSNGPSQEPSKSQESAPASEAESEELLIENDGVIKSGRYTLPSRFEISFSSSVRNDVTGRWRISTTSDSFVPAEYAVEYYKTMFSSDDEIHAIWNATLGTTTRITVSYGIIFADTLEYVKGEEHDAKILFSGALLDSKMFDAQTGEEILE